MKPINLKIKGLNSFIEMQEVNFQRLTEKGLFGIFGPTGSGKSTILDGITLALYGEVSRNSSNFINTNCDSMYVSYEFQITEKEIKRYRVEREFNRDKKTGNVKSKSAKIVDITFEEQVLEDKIRSVTAKCEEIIGLKLEDFTRTVVLPQGKFSEFLKLTGKDRRDMLERLFNLQKYGDGLTFKLKNKIDEETQKANRLDGELNGYEDISDEILKEKNKELDNTKEQFKKCSLELQKSEKAYSEGKELWNLQKNLLELQNGKIILKEKEEEISRDKLRVVKGESALKIKPYMDNYESTIQQIEKVNMDIEKLKTQTETIKEKKLKIETVLQEAKNKKDNDLPLYRVKEQKVLDAIEDKNALTIYVNENKIIKENILKIETQISNINKDIELCSNNINIINSNISSKEEKVESLVVPEEFKNKVNDGFVILNSYENLKKHIDKLSNNLNSTKTEINKFINQSEVLSKNLSEKEKLYKTTEDKLQVLINNCPGNQDTLLELNEKLKQAKDKYDKNNEYITTLNKCHKKAEEIKKTLIDTEHKKISLDKEIKHTREVIKKIETENLAIVLREALTDGESCPVCGSKEHHRDNIEVVNSINDLETLRQELSVKENKSLKYTSQIIEYQTNLKREETTIVETEDSIKVLGHDFKSISIETLQEQFNKLYSEINKYDAEKSNLEKSIKIISDEKNKLNLEYSNISSYLNHNRESFKKLQEEFNSKNIELKEAEEKLSLLKEELNIVDFKLIREEISKKEKEKSILEKEIKVHRESLKQETEKKENLVGKLSDLMIELKEKKTTLIEKEKSIEEKKKSIISKVGDIENLEEVKEKILKIINRIIKQYEEAEKYKNEIENVFNNLNNEIISAQGNLVSLKERIIKEKEALNKALEHEDIKDTDEVKNNLISKVELEKLKSKIEFYNNSLAQFNGAIANLEKKIDNRSLTQDQWNEIQSLREEKTALLNSLQEISISLETEVKTIIVKLESKKVILKKKEELDYKLGLLNDLSSLFRGKKFVEFVAANALKYVSIEGSKKLKEITGGTYGLEVDENGRFIIRDYKNGGAERDASTLSGGETFVASLALALALSSQIQLKGTAPLELFFLDEGFGTLDDDLLEVVMDSLEKIHNDKLSIGIISHVESIKNRVPVKLLVTSAEAGMGGSKVKIERS